MVFKISANKWIAITLVNKNKNYRKIAPFIWLLDAAA